MEKTLSLSSRGRQSSPGLTPLNKCHHRQGFIGMLTSAGEGKKTFGGHSIKEMAFQCVGKTAYNLIGKG